MSLASLATKRAPSAPGTPTCSWVAFDIETTNGRPEDAEAWARNLWSPDRRWKAETIGSRYLEVVSKKEERLALLDAAPIVCISVRTEFELWCLHAMEAHEPRSVHGGVVAGYATEGDMLVAFRTLLDSRVPGPDVPLVGHNILGFDLRKLRWRYLKQNLRLPVALAAKEQAVYDTMVEYGRRFSTDRDLFISLSGVLEALGVDSHKDLVDGSTVPDLYEAKQYDTIIRYALLDVLAEADLYLRMTGQNADAA